MFIYKTQEDIKNTTFIKVLKILLLLRSEGESRQDPAVTAIMDAAPYAAAVCHGPEALIGSKWLHPGDGKVGPFISYYGAWMSFRDIPGYERKKPGEICEDASGRLFTGNAPNSTKAMVVRACEAISASKK